MAEVNDDNMAKMLLRRFIKLPYGAKLEFYCLRGQGDAMIQRMRVRLSKVKKKAIASGISPQEFKMIRVNVEETVFPKEGFEFLAGEPADMVTLCKTTNSVTRASQLLGVIDEDLAAVNGGVALKKGA